GAQARRFVPFRSTLPLLVRTRSTKTRGIAIFAAIVATSRGKPCRTGTITAPGSSAAKRLRTSRTRRLWFSSPGPKASSVAGPLTVTTSLPSSFESRTHLGRRGPTFMVVPSCHGSFRGVSPSKSAGLTRELRLMPRTPKGTGAPPQPGRECSRSRACEAARVRVRYSGGTLTHEVLRMKRLVLLLPFALLLSGCGLIANFIPDQEVGDVFGIGSVDNPSVVTAPAFVDPSELGSFLPEARAASDYEETELKFQDFELPNLYGFSIDGLQVTIGLGETVTLERDGASGTFPEAFTLTSFEGFVRVSDAEAIVPAVEYHFEEQP